MLEFSQLNDEDGGIYTSQKEMRKKEFS